MLERLGIGAKLTLAFGALAAVTVLVVVFGFFAGASVTRDIGSRKRRALRLRSLQRGAGEPASMQLHVRGYLVLGEPLDIEQYYVITSRHSRWIWRRCARSRRPGARRGARGLAVTRDYEQWVRLPQQLFELHDNPLKNRPALRLARLEVQPRRVEVLATSTR